ncbi:MAG: hypothetical protein KAY37_15655 [Phycisphaerae bacterium]|nr:hypothetical protein [Phycisphaerae bacterium]
MPEANTAFHKPYGDFLKEKSRGTSLLLLIVLGAWSAAASAQIVAGGSRVTAVGFPAACTTGNVLRGGQWFPIRVVLKVEGTDVFSGELRFEGIDLDGDRVAFSRSVTVTPKPDGSPTTATLYAVVNAINELPRHIHVVDERGESIAKLPLLPCELISNDNLLVLDIGAQRVPKLNLLETPGWSPGQPTDGSRTFYRDVIVSNLPARDLPRHWWGLEAVDVIFWDRPNPAELEFAQLDALVEWVRGGGQLIVGLGESWGAIRGTALESIMPLQGPGPPQETSKLDMFIRRVGLRGRSGRELDGYLTVTTADLAEDAVRTLSALGPRNETINLISMRLVGSGRVVATAAGLRDLAELRVDHEKFFAELLDLNRYTEEFKKGQNNFLLNIDHLYDDFVEPIALRRQSALLGLTAFLFVSAYILVATLATWWWLRGRKLTHLSWAVFAVLAIVASVLSLGTVTGMRSFSRGVQSLSILDLEAGSRAARGPCLFGYRSSLRQRVELSLPGEGNFLRPLASAPLGSTYYVTPARYAAVPTQTKLEQVLMRATLKQVEGYWHGELEGTIRGNLVVARDDGRLTSGSWIANELDVDLAGGYLLFCDPRQQGVDVPRAAGLTSLYELPESLGGKPAVKDVPPAMNVLVVRLPKIPVGERINAIGATQYQQVDKAYGAWSGKRNRKRSQMLTKSRDLQTLWHEQQYWRGNITFASRLSRPAGAALLASTRNFHLHSQAGNLDRVATPLNTNGLQSLDSSHWLLGGRRAGQAVLLCWSNTPGPARLHLKTAWQKEATPQRSHEGWTFYRVQIPIYYQGSPPSGEGDGP